MYRKRQNQLLYNRYPRSESCAFCNLDDLAVHPKPRNIITQGKTMYVTANQYPYDFWEQLAVSEHLLLVPNRHITTMEDLTEAERKEYTDIVCRYEAIGYDVYTRAPNSQIRSVMHIHTHLIKTRGRGSRAYLNIRKPYFLTRW